MLVVDTQLALVVQVSVGDHSLEISDLELG